MHSLLRKFDINQLKSTDVVMLDYIQAEFIKLLQKLKDADELKKEKKPEMIAKLESDVTALIKNVVNTAS